MAALGIQTDGCAQKALTLHDIAEGTRQGFLEQTNRSANHVAWQADLFCTNPLLSTSTSTTRKPESAYAQQMASHWPPEDAPSVRDCSYSAATPVHAGAASHRKSTQSKKTNLATPFSVASGAPYAIYLYLHRFSRMATAGTLTIWRTVSRGFKKQNHNPCLRLLLWLRQGTNLKKSTHPPPVPEEQRGLTEY